MKKIFLNCICALTILSCSRDKVSNEYCKLLKNTSLLKIRETSRISYSISQKTPYKLLTDFEKFSFWNNRFKLVLKNKRLNRSQKKLVLMLQKELKADVFSKSDNDHKTYFMNTFVNIYLIKLQYSFTNSQIETIFYSQNNLTDSESILTCNCGSKYIFGNTCASGKNTSKNNPSTSSFIYVNFLMLRG